MIMQKPLIINTIKILINARNLSKELVFLCQAQRTCLTVKTVAKRIIQVEGTFIFYVIGGNKLSIFLFHSNILRLKEILMSQVLVWHG